VICISERVAHGVRAGLEQSANISVVYNGVDPSLFAPEAGVELPRPVILSVGNLIAIKGHELLLRAVAAITPSHPRLECKIIGDGPERARLQALARELHLEDCIRFMGRRSRAEVAQAMRECTLFALPSSYEGLGCVYLEAMSAERATIGCRGQGIDEVIRHGKNGWLIQPNDVGELTSALQRLLSDRTLRETIGKEGRHTILEGFTLVHQAERLMSIYRDCIA
jgi:glycosyltransferase involved in cell wall biosynthesis